MRALGSKKGIIMKLIPFSKVEHHSLQLVVWISRVFFLIGSFFVFLGSYLELRDVYRWLASPIYSDDGTAWRTYSYKLDLLDSNWYLIIFGSILILLTCYLVVKINESNEA